MGFTVHKEVVHDFGLYLGAEAGLTLPRIEELAREEGMSDHGFTGMLEPLGEIVNGDASMLVGSAFSLMQRKLCDLGDGVIDAANVYGTTDDGGASLFELNGLDDGAGEKVSHGSGYGRDGYGAYGEGGHSNFHYTQLDIAPPERPNTRFSDDIEDFSLVLTVLDWIWTEFVPGDKGFTDSLIAPLSGNYKSIEANGEAWTSVGKNFGLFASNLLDNASTLATKHWQGAAAKAFEQFLDLFWHDGAVWAGQKLGQFVAEGFNKIADVSKRIAALAIKAINDIIRVAARIATKAIPVVGWAWTAIESAAKALGDLFGIDIDNLYDDIMTIVDTARTVVTLFDAMEKLVEIMKHYFNTLEELVATVKQIPDVGSLKDAVLTSRTIDEHLGTLDKQQTELEQQTGRADDALGKLEDIATSAEGAP